VHAATGKLRKGALAHPMWRVAYPFFLAASAMVKVRGESGRLSPQDQAGFCPQPSAPVMQSRLGVRPVSAAERVGEHTPLPACRLERSVHQHASAPLLSCSGGGERLERRRTSGITHIESVEEDRVV
jgi:hypothetical protein